MNPRGIGLVILLTPTIQIGEPGKCLRIPANQLSTTGRAIVVGAGDAVEVREGGDVGKEEGEAGETVIEVVDEETVGVEEGAAKDAAEEEAMATVAVVEEEVEEEGAEEKDPHSHSTLLNLSFSAVDKVVINLFSTFLCNIHMNTQSTTLFY
jgi:hypothetical protein